MNNRKKWIYYFLAFNLSCYFSSFGYINGSEENINGMKEVQQKVDVNEDDKNKVDINEVFKKADKFFLSRKRLSRKRGKLSEKQSILYSFGIINNTKGMGYQIKDNMSTKAKIFIKLISIISSQLNWSFSKEYNKRNLFGLALRNKISISKINSLYENLCNIISSAKLNEKALDVWYNALCQTACKRSDLQEYEKTIKSKQLEKEYPFLCAYRCYRLKKSFKDLANNVTWKEFKHYLIEKDPDKTLKKLTATELQAAIEMQEKLNLTMKQILQAVAPEHSKLSTEQWCDKATGGTWCQLKVFENDDPVIIDILGLQEN